MLEKKIGFIQGRLSPMSDGKIQAFPWQYWEDEFDIGAKYNWHIMEWTLDADTLYENPLMTNIGRERIVELCAKTDFVIPSLTGDFFMQKPFFKEKDFLLAEKLFSDLIAVVEACGKIGINILVLPLVDNGRIENLQQQEKLLINLARLERVLIKHEVKVAFESDLPAKELKNFIQKLNSHCYGINYDIGNSACLGFDYSEEINSYFESILNVHVKDRILGGTTVPLGSGNANIPSVLTLLDKKGYPGNYIMQTARAHNDDHVGILNQYRDQVINWME